jgi:hypothetical protein
VHLDPAYGPVERSPDHHAGVGEVPFGTADLPQPVIRLVPLLGQPLHQDALQVPRVLVVLEPSLARDVERDHHLAEHVGLALVDGSVADPHRSGVGVSRKMFEFALGKVSTSVDGVHDLHALGIARDGADQPVAPEAGLFLEPCGDHRFDRQGRVS